VNYLHKNLKALRNFHSLTQEKFGEMFGLNLQNIKSYENKTVPPIEKFIDIMDHFNLHPARFVKLDIERYDLSLDGNSDSIDLDDASLAKVSIGIPRVSDYHRYKFINDMPPEKMKKLSKSLMRDKEHMTRQLMESQFRVNRLQDEIINLLKNKKK